jgi:hypothetical protein
MFAEVPAWGVYTLRLMPFLITTVAHCRGTAKRGGVFYQGKDQKSPKLDLVVVRVNKSGDACNARPCYNCLDMMKAVGIRKVYYSVSSTELVCENVKDMVSIQSSSVTKHIEKLKGNKVVDDPEKYYEQLLKKNFPESIKTYNLENFITHNLKNVLPNYKIKIDSSEGNKYVWIINSNNTPIIKASIL